MTRGGGTGNDDTPTARPVGDRSDPVGAALADLLRDSRTDDAVAGRRRTHWIRTQARAGATFDGVLEEAASSAAPVTLGTADGLERSGSVVEVGADVVVVAGSDGATRLLPLGRVTWVVVEGPELLGVGDASAADRSGEFTDDADDLDTDARTTLWTTLASWADDRLPTRLCSGTRVFAGELRWVGLDVVAVDGGTPGRIAYVRLSSLAEASLNVSG